MPTLTSNKNDKEKEKERERKQQKRLQQPYWRLILMWCCSFKHAHKERRNWKQGGDEEKEEEITKYVLYIYILVMTIKFGIIDERKMFSLSLYCLKER